MNRIENPEAALLAEREALPQGDFEAHTKFFDKHPELITGKFLNNFHGNLPGGYKHEYTDEELHRERLRLFITPERYATKLKNHSDKWLDQTDQAFWQEVEDAARELGWDIEKVKTMQTPALREQLGETCIPLYRKLRERGYSHLDLVT